MELLELHASKKRRSFASGRGNLSDKGANRPPFLGEASWQVVNLLKSLIVIQPL